MKKQKIEKRLIGYVGCDSGQIVICDPCYIDSQWEQEEFEDIRIFEHAITKVRLQYKKDFDNFEEIIPAYGQTMNTLLAINNSKDWLQIESLTAIFNFSYNACCNANSNNIGGQLNYAMGHPGVAVAISGFGGDGRYPVYVEIDEQGVRRVIIEFR